MARYVKAKREEIQRKKYRGFLAQFIIFLILRSIDLAASISVLQNAWSHSADWKSLNNTLFKTTNNVPRNFNSSIIKSRNVHPRSINLQRIESRSIRLRNLLPQNLDPPNLDSRKFRPRHSDPRKNDPPRKDPGWIDLQNFQLKKVGARNNSESTIFDPRKFVRRNKIPRRFIPGKTNHRRNEQLDIKRRSIDSQSNSYTSNDAQYTSVDSRSSTTTDLCQHIDQWDKKEVLSDISKYKAILGLAVFFNIVSISVFLTHFAFWIATLKIIFQDGTEQKTRVTQLTRNSLLSLLTAIFRDVPLSCLNVELLAERSGRDGLACVACIFANKCRQEDYVVGSLNLAKSLLYFNYFMMLINSLWKGVSGFYRLSRFKEFNIYLIRACASIVFGFLYSIATFTPAMFMFIYRYFAMPELESPFLHDLASRLVVLGATIWVIFVSVAVCCPILYVIRLNAD